MPSEEDKKRKRDMNSGSDEPSANKQKVIVETRPATYVPPMPQGVSLSPQAQPQPELPPYLSTVADTIYPPRREPVSLQTRAPEQAVIIPPSPGALPPMPGGLTTTSAPVAVEASPAAQARVAQAQAFQRNPKITPEELRAIADEIYARSRQ